MPPNPRKVILNMLIKRGYHIENPTEFITLQDEEYLASSKGDLGEKIYVFFPSSSKVGVSTIRQYINQMKENKVPRAIVVVRDSITAFANKVEIEAPLIIEYFKENELYIDKLEHVLVPKHELITEEEEKKEILKVYKIKENQLPKILSSDAIARYFGARKGQVFKITRYSETSGESIYYRIVV